LTLGYWSFFLLL